MKESIKKRLYEIDEKIIKTNAKITILARELGYEFEEEDYISKDIYQDYSLSSYPIVTKEIKQRFVIKKIKK